VCNLGKEAEGLVENGTIFSHVEFTFVMGGSRSPPRNAAGAPCPGHDGLVAFQELLAKDWVADQNSAGR